MGISGPQSQNVPVIHPQHYYSDLKLNGYLTQHVLKPLLNHHVFGALSETKLAQS